MQWWKKQESPCFSCGECQEPDHCIWWEAVDMKTGCADYHATTKKFLMEQIDEDLTCIYDELHCVD